MSALLPSNRRLPPEQDQIRSVLSLELSLVSSSDANELAAVFSHEEEEIAPSMTTACELIHSILDQVTWDDAPPSNDDTNVQHPQQAAQHHTQPYSRQCHVPPQLVSNGSSLSTNSNQDPSVLWNQSYKMHSNPSEKKLGNAALATLCARTLETVGKSSEPTKSSGEMENKPSLANARAKESPRKKSQHQSLRMRTWLRRRNAKEAVSPPRYGEIVVSQQTTKQEINTLDQENRSPSHRLQMFGSEYARYLSTTALAPKDVHPIRGPIMPRTNLNRRKNQNAIQNIEDAELSALTGPITDLVVTVGDDHPPKGYFRISQSAGGDKFFLRDKKTPVYINVKKETNWDRAAQRPCVTALALIFPQRQEFVPPGFSVARTHSLLPKNSDRNPANLSLGEEQVFLCFRRSREGNPITAILPLLPAKRESIPEGFTVLERTPRNHVAAIQTHSSQVFLAYRQRLANLEPLRPLPLVMSVHSSATTRKLNAYYCTGGTVVPSRVGRFHIMDRSTHNLLSPSSISNRLSLIEASRRKTFNTISDLPNEMGNNYVYSLASPRKPNSPKETLTSTLLVAHGLGTACSHSIISDLEKLSVNGDNESDVSSDMNGTIHLSEQEMQKLVSPSMSNISGISEEEGSHANRSQTIQSLQSNEATELERCLEALSFIPVVSTAIEEDDPRGMLRFQARVAVLTPILTACYTRHGGSALLAVEGLVELLRGDFFSSDVNLEQDSTTRITLLDIAIQVACDVATMGAQETHLQACVEFVESAVKFGCGHLNTRTVGYVMRFYLFVFYFGVSTYSGGNGIWGTVGERDEFILEDPRSLSVRYLPGGAPQAAILSLKDLISFSMARLRSLITSERMLFRFGSPPSKRRLAPDLFNEMINGLVEELVDQSVHRVEIANYTQLAMHQILRSGGSELFWYDMMNSCGSGLFGNDDALREETRIMYSMLFAILTNCVKVASTKVRKDKNNDGVPRDVASKLMSLEMIHFFLLQWDGIGDMEIPKSSSFPTFVYAIRRLVVPCLLLNTTEAVEDPKVYRRVINIIGVLWSSPLYRQHMKLELAILMDHFVIKILRLGPQILFKEKPKNEGNAACLFAQQIQLMKSLQVWFSDSPGLLELFLNFDTDQEEKEPTVSSSQELLSGLHWKTTQKICAALCITCERCSEFIAEKIRESQAMRSGAKDEDIEVLEGVSGTTLARESAQRLRKSALDTIGRLIRNLAESAAATKGPKFRELVDSWGKRSETFLSDIPHIGSDLSSPSDSDEDRLNERQGMNAGILGFWQKEIFKKEEKAAEVKARVVQNEASKINHLLIAFDISKEKGLRKGIDYLIACSVLTPSPRDIASFLRLHRSELEPAALGKYLGEGGSDVSETEYWNLIRFSFIRAISFVGMTVEQGLRHLLTNGGFRLPGEAQQVDRVMTTFAQCYWEDNAGDQVNCPFKEQDTVFLISFAIIMLNTDLHKSIPVMSKGKKSTTKRMTKVEFINNLKGAFNKTDELSPEYLSIIYDSIEANPIVLNDDLATSDCDPCLNSDRLSMDLSAIAKNAKSLEALLRGLSTHEYKFTSIDDHSQQALFDGNLSDATAFLVRKIMSQTWHQFHGLINAAVENAHLDLEGMDSCASILKYALSLTICLDMPMERSAFLGQLGRFRLFNSTRAGVESDEALQSSTKGEQNFDYKHEDWYTGIEEACTPDGKKTVTTMDRSKIMALKLIDELIVDLSRDHSSSDNDKGRKATQDAVRCLANAEYLLNDPTRRFLRTGRLWKRANRSGRLVEYRFFLFSDVLIYAKKIPSSSTAAGAFMQYKIHGELQLILMKVTDWFQPEHKKEADRGFQIYHPRKSFLVFAANREERSSWVSMVRTAIDKEVARKVAMEGARKAAARSH